MSLFGVTGLTLALMNNSSAVTSPRAGPVRADQRGNGQFVSRWAGQHLIKTLFRFLCRFFNFYLLICCLCEVEDRRGW